jgi:hypothetical protein
MQISSYRQRFDFVIDSDLSICLEEPDIQDFVEHPRSIECAQKNFDSYVKQFEEDGSIFVSRPLGAVHTGPFECYFRELNGKNLQVVLKSIF